MIKSPVHNLDLFWRDLQACCFTSLRVVADDLPTRISSMAARLQHLSTLQLYGIALDAQPFPLVQSKPAPATGSERRLELSLFPFAEINPSAGITYIKLAIPGPVSEFSQSLDSSQPNMSHPFWQMLDQEIFPFLCLPNGVPIHQVAGAKRIKSVALVQLPEERRPQPGRPPVAAALVSNAEYFEQAQSAIARLQRANQQPPDQYFTRVENYKKRLDHLHLLQDLERKFFALAAQPQSIFKVTIRKSLEETSTSLVAKNLDLPTPANKYLPALPGQGEQIWADIPAADFSNPQCWAQLLQLKQVLDIPSERSFWRNIQNLRSAGLRTLPAKQDARIQLFYQPDLPMLLTQWQEHKPKRGRASHKAEAAPQPAPTITSQSSTPAQPEIPYQPTDTDKTAIWSAINTLLSQQELFREQQVAIVQSLSRIETSLTALLAHQQSIHANNSILPTADQTQQLSQPKNEEN
jgi:hypothetical protein